MTRKHMNHEELEASRILDLWRSGADDTDGITLGLIGWCFRVLGDGVAS